MRPLLIATALATLVTPVLAQDAPPPPDKAPLPAPVSAPPARPKPPKPPKPPEMDFSRSVTLTGSELRLLMQATALRVQAEAAAQAAAAVNAKVEAALTVPEKPTEAEPAKP